MAGHSKFKNIMHRKSAQDKKRASLHGRVIREIVVAVRLGGADVSANSRLRLALLSARSANLGKDAITRAIKRASGEHQAGQFQEARYEGYGAHGIAFIVETASDNRNRTAAELRMLFSKNGGQLAQEGAVTHFFDHIGLIAYDQLAGSPDELFDIAAGAGAQDVNEEDNMYYVTTALGDFHAVLAALTQKWGEPCEAKLIWHAKNPLAVNQDQAIRLEEFKLMLEDYQDVVAVFSNHQVAA